MTVEPVEVDLATEPGVEQLYRLKTKAQAVGSRVMPDSVKPEMHRKQAEPGSA